MVKFLLLSILICVLFYVGVPQKLYSEIANYRGQTTEELTIDIRNSTADYIDASSDFIVNLLRTQEVPIVSNHP